MGAEAWEAAAQAQCIYLSTAFCARHVLAQLVAEDVHCAD